MTSAPAPRLLPPLVLLLAGCPGPPQAPTRPPARAGSIAIEVVPEPLYAGAVLTAGSLLARRGELDQIQFHVNLTNRSRRPVRIERVVLTSLRGGRVLSRLSLEREGLRRRLRPAAWPVIRDRQTISTFLRSSGLLRRQKGNTLLRPGAACSLTHQFFVTRTPLTPDRLRCTVHHRGGRSERVLAVERHTGRTRLRLPFAGKWFVLAGFRFEGYHGEAVYRSQNFAYDLARLGATLSTVRAGDPRLPGSYAAHGQPILAVADGEVVRVQDDIADNNPVGRGPGWTAVMRNPHVLAGNYVVVKHHEHEFSAYLHLQPGLELAPGDRVRAGQPVGRCGNSGNSLEPHLHFQLQDGPDLLTANGLPARFSDFTIQLAHLKLYVSPASPLPLPVRLFVEPGRAAGAIDASRMLR